MIGNVVAQTLSRRIWLKRSLAPAGAAAAAALLFKDSGVATVDFIAAVTLVIVLYYAISDTVGNRAPLSYVRMNQPGEGYEIANDE